MTTILRNPSLLLLFAGILAATGVTVCNAAVNDIQAGSYRVVLQLPGGELPFGLDLAREGTAWVGYLINGKERLKLSEVSVEGSRLGIKMPGYENVLTADKQGDELTGELVLDKLGGKDQHIPVHARFRQSYRFFPPAVKPTANVAGRWSVKFTEEGGKSEMAVGEFSQTHDVVTGTFLTDTGDHRYLAGQVRDGELYLSTFDGAHAFLYKAKLTAAGGLDGDYWSGTAYHERFTAQRDAQAALPDAYSLTALQKGTRRFDFAFPDLTGHEVTSQEARFQHKVMVVALAGSWCPNCHDEAAFLAPLYDAYRARGLEIVSLMFEHFGDFERAAAATQRFRQHYDIHYTTLIAGISDKDDAAKKLPALDRVYAFPTLIFIDRKGLVRQIHTGFSGPATGEHYTQFVAEFKHTLDLLLAET
jgi:thiol-disulfide isomerase/thioredoxin